MTRKSHYKYKPKVIADAITECHGMLSVAARRIGCSLTTIYVYRDKFPVVREAIRDSRELMTDTAELSLAEAVKNGESWAVTFYLKTQGKNRGYVERMEQVNLTDEDVNRLIDNELKRLEKEQGITAGNDAE